MRRRARIATVTFFVLALVAGGCGGDDDDDGGSASGDLSGSIKVSAASSLTESFEALASQFEADHEGTDIQTNFASSSELVTQIQEEGGIDVFASADQANMDKIVDSEDNEGEPIDFARNQLAIAVEPGNPKNIDSLDDLANPDIDVVLCADTAPCGKFADQVLEAANVEVTPVSRPENAKATISVIENGEADAAIVYVTDVQASDDVVDGVTIPDEENVITTLPIVTLKDTTNQALADAWVEFITSPDTQQLLVDDYGFLPLT